MQICTESMCLPKLNCKTSQQNVRCVRIYTNYNWMYICWYVCWTFAK